MDLPGFGAAPALATAPTVSKLTDAVEGQLDRGGLGEVHVAGNSLGGWIAVELARRGRARSVVALAPAGMELAPERGYVVALNEVMRLRAKAAAPFAATLARSRVWRSAVLGPMRARPWRVRPHDAVEEIRVFASAPGFQATLRHRRHGRAIRPGLHRCPGARVLRPARRPAGPADRAALRGRPCPAPS